MREGDRTQTKQEKTLLTETRKKKKLRDNPIAPWELKFGDFRIFYVVKEDVVTVVVVSIGRKEHNTLYIKKTTLIEDVLAKVDTELSTTQK